MTLHAVVLFLHVLGALLLFAAFGLEWLCLRGLRRATSLEQLRAWSGAAALLPRFHAFSGPLIIFAGAYLATKMDAWAQGWISIALLVVVVMLVLGMGISGRRVKALIKASMQDNAVAADLVSRAYAPILRYSLRLRIALGLGVVYLMGSKSPMEGSIVVIGIAAAAGLAASAIGPQPKAAS